MKFIHCTNCGYWKWTNSHNIEEEICDFCSEKTMKINDGFSLDKI